jgi:hypothetical protein
MGQSFMYHGVSDTDTPQRTGLKKLRRITKGKMMPRNEYFAMLMT